LAFQLSLTREKAVRVKRPSTSLAINPSLLLTLLACMTFPTPVFADDERQSETVPEVNAYIRLSDRFRLFATASVTQSLTEGPTDGEIGAYLDFLSLRPIFRERLFDIDLARNRYLWGRIGYAIAGIHEGLRLSEGYSETRFVAELSGRYPISRGFWILTRARIDMRTLSGERSNRYRFRLGLEKEYTVLGRALIPYVRAEFLYDTRFDAWNRQIYQIGVEIELTQRFRIEPSYAFQIDTATPPTHLDRVGVVLTYHR
jgi:hypothetical protein